MLTSTHQGLADNLRPNGVLTDHLKLIVILFQIVKKGTGGGARCNTSSSSVILALHCMLFFADIVQRDHCLSFAVGRSGWPTYGWRSGRR